MIYNIYKILLLSSFSLNVQAVGNSPTLTESPADIAHSIAIKEKNPQEIHFEKAICDAAEAAFKKNRLIDMRSHQRSNEEFIASVNALWQKVYDHLDVAILTANAMGKDRKWVMAEFSKRYNSLLLNKPLSQDHQPHKSVKLGSSNLDFESRT